MVKTLHYRVSFVTPAFLGGADQSAQWRTPPFKALLRQWWRVAYAADHHFGVTVEAMRREEGFLFGNAWLSHNEGNKEVTDYRKSLVRIRLDKWEQGKLDSWQGLEQPTVFHPETEKTGFKVGPHAYLGYGPLDGRGNTQFDKKRNAAIQVGEGAELSLACPEVEEGRLRTALWLIDRYGAVGGRSRNGWGSFSLTPLDGTPALAGELPMRPWRDALEIDWPHAIGCDDKGPLVWTTDSHTDWKHVMRELAIVKIGLRTQFVFPDERPPHPNVEPRHWLSYPITTHITRAWNRGARLPNSLRFKLRPVPSDPGKLIGVVFHVPCLPPPAFRPERQAIEKTWKAVHALLDELTRPVASRGYSSIADASRREKLKRELLDRVSLTRRPE